MANEPFADFLNAVLEKHRNGGSTFVTDNANIVIGESKYGLAHKNATTYFPRLEALITKLKYDGYTDQRIVDQAFRFSLAGHLKRAQDDTTDSDMWNAIKIKSS